MTGHELLGFDGEPVPPARPLASRPPWKRYRVIATGWRWWKDGTAYNVERYRNGAGLWDHVTTVGSEAAVLTYVQTVLKAEAAAADSSSDTSPQPKEQRP